MVLCHISFKLSKGGVEQKGNQSPIDSLQAFVNSISSTAEELDQGWLHNIDHMQFSQ